MLASAEYTRQLSSKTLPALGRWSPPELQLLHGPLPGTGGALLGASRKLPHAFWAADRAMIALNTTSVAGWEERRDINIFACTTSTILPGRPLCLARGNSRMTKNKHGGRSWYMEFIWRPTELEALLWSPAVLTTLSRRLANLCAALRKGTPNRRLWLDVFGIRSNVAAVVILGTFSGTGRS